ncbi:MAG: site-2 protease family protein [Candidatus Omnitrophota bacterium]
MSIESGFATLLLLVFLFLSITVHEFSHGWVADKLGDSTARQAGRLSLNPLRHIDVFGTLILPVVLLLASHGSFSFGYAKPVPVNPYHFRNPRRGMMWVALAGPAVNVLMGIFFALLLKAGWPFFTQALLTVMIINFALGFFNMVPIPPLDGSKIVAAFLPPRASYKYLKMEIAGIIAIIILLQAGIFNWFLESFLTIALKFLDVRI